MCGIIGFQGNNLNLLQSGLELIKHRGPDYTSYFTNHSISLGHCLLSLRGNLDDGIQPKFSKLSPWVLIFNGQIYNTERLISENKLNSNRALKNDTNVLYEIINIYGWEFYKYIYGMYSIVLYNKDENRVCLYRDHSGQKPLYYSNKNKLSFSSELKFFKLSNKDYTTNYDAVHIAAALGYIPGNQTLIKDIYKVAPGYCYDFDLNTNKLTKIKMDPVNINSYYDDNNPHSIMSKNISEHMQSNSRININLSAGLDSSLILVEALKHDKDIYTYTNSYDTNSNHNDDLKLVKKLSKTLGFKNININMSKMDYIDNLVEAYETIEEPCYNISAPMNLFNAKFHNNEGNRVVLTGDGGDELFCGYSYYKKSELIEKLDIFPINMFVRKIKNFRKKISFNIFDPYELWLNYKCFYNQQIFNKNIDIKKTLSSNKNNFNIQLQGKNLTHDLMLIDRATWLANENFNRSDKIFMSQSIEARNPYAYYPFQIKFDNLLKKKDYSQKINTKLYIRNNFSNVLPDFILNAKKIGYRAPVELWYDNKMKDFYIDLFDNSFKNTNLFNYKVISKMLKNNNNFPGKHLQAILSIGIIASKFNLPI